MPGAEVDTRHTTVLGRVVDWLTVKQSSTLLEVIRLGLVICNEPMLHVLRSGNIVSRYLSITPGNSPTARTCYTGDTLQWLHEQANGLNMSADLNAVLTLQGNVRSHVPMLMLLDRLVENKVQLRTIAEPKMLKRVMRLQFVLRHLTEMEGDHFNIHTAAYLNPELYGCRAFLTLTLQMFSLGVIYTSNKHNAHTLSHFSNLDSSLIVMFMIWLFSTLPTLLLPNTLTRSVLLTYLFCQQGMLKRALFTTFDFINQALILMMIPTAALAMLGSTSTISIVFNSLSVLFVIRMDDTAFNPGEKMYLHDNESMLIDSFVQKLDDYMLPDFVGDIVAWLPLMEVVGFYATFLWALYLIS